MIQVRYNYGSPKNPKALNLKPCFWDRWSIFSPKDPWIDLSRWRPLAWKERSPVTLCWWQSLVPWRWGAVSDSDLRGIFGVQVVGRILGCCGSISFLAGIRISWLEPGCYLLGIIWNPMVACSNMVKPIVFWALHGNLSVSSFWTTPCSIGWHRLNSQTTGVSGSRGRFSTEQLGTVVADTFQ